ncbi:MAG: carboxypeptidase-like regulatory domain-containing protein [Thermonemataceae bacterium]
MKTYLTILSVVVFLCNSHLLLAQGDVEPMILTGFLIDAETESPMPYANVLIPRAGVGTSANHEGQFRMRVFAGDSLVISSVGYRTSFYIIPEDKVESYTVIIPVNQSVEMLAPVEVFPYPTEQSFKEAFLALNTEDERTANLKKNLDARNLAKMGFELGMDGSLNYRNTMNQQSDALHSRNSVRSTQFLNPFAWAKFIKSIKNGDLKKGKYKDYMKE